MKRYGSLIPLILLAIAASACAGSEPTATSTPTRTPTSIPSAAFTLDVLPDTIEDISPGQHGILLVTASDGDGPISVSVSAPSAVAAVQPRQVLPGQVCEVTITPDPDSVGQTLEVTIDAKRGAISESATVKLTITETNPNAADLTELAFSILDRFVPWLEKNYPDLGITSDTEWTPVLIRPHHLVVMYHLFFSERWEVGMRWHVTIAPHDWAGIYLRDRAAESYPTYAFQIPSLQSGDKPREMDVAEFMMGTEIWR